MYNPRPDLVSPGLALPQRYKVRGGSRKIIGVQATPTITVIDDASAGGETTGWTKNIDYTSYSYGAVMSLVNTTAGTRTISNVVIKGKPVEMLQGAEGIIHDAFIDYNSVYEDGEKKVEWGNDFIVSVTQTNQIADYLWKEFRTKKHIYMLSLPGTRYNYEPGDWYWLQIGGSGQIEYIDSVVEVFQVETYRAASELGNTMVMLKEVQEAWKKDSTAYARFIASGRTYNLPAQLGGIRVGSQYSTDKCDVYCDGTSDEDEINQAITILSTRYGGGIVHLTKGTFKIDGVITLMAGVVLEGEGNATIIEKNCNDYAIECDGGAGTEILNAGIRNLEITRNAADTNDILLIYLDYADDFIVENVLMADAYTDGFQAINCDRLYVKNLKLEEFGSGGASTGIQFDTACTGVVSGLTVDGLLESKGNALTCLDIFSGLVVSDIMIKDATVSAGNLIGMRIATDRCMSSNINIENLTSTSATTVYGLILLNSDLCRFSGVTIYDIDNSHTAANSQGIRIDEDASDCDDNSITGVLVTGCSGTGIVIEGDNNTFTGRTTGNGTQLTDAGANNNVTALDST